MLAVLLAAVALGLSLTGAVIAGRGRDELAT